MGNEVVMPATICNSRFRLISSDIDELNIVIGSGNKCVIRSTLFITRRKLSRSLRITFSTDCTIIAIRTLVTKARKLHCSERAECLQIIGVLPLRHLQGDARQDLLAYAGLVCRVHSRK